VPQCAYEHSQGVHSTQCSGVLAEAHLYIHNREVLAGALLVYVAEPPSFLRRFNFLLQNFSSFYIVAFLLFFFLPAREMHIEECSNE